LAVAARLRAGGLAVDVWVGSGRLGKQLRHADRRGATWAIIRGADERAAATVGVKHLASGDQTSVAEADLLHHLTQGDTS
jgi:histidyl-tRNA synthetase